MYRGFTLLELVVVVIILGILATLGFTQYTKMVEKGRTAEAKLVLGQIRSAQQAYNMQYGGFTTVIGNLPVQPPTACGASGNHYFSYNVSATTATARRCTANGKLPVASSQYRVTLTYGTGVFGGTAGYY